MRRSTQVIDRPIQKEEHYFELDVGLRKVTLRPIQPEKFVVDDPKAKEYLDKNGYVVFKQVATKPEVTELVDLFWENMTIESEGRIKQVDMNTWQNYAWQGYVEAGINWSYGIPQSKFMWKARGLPTVQRLFKTVWGEEDLLVSMDSCGAFRPPEFDERWRTKKGWFHVDQNGYVKKKKQAVQGLLNLIPNGHEDGGLVILPQSVHTFGTLFKKYKNLCDLYGPDYAEMNGNHITELWESDMQPIKICMDEGDFVCWDSRTVHCNHPAKVLPLREGPYLRRLVAYICMTPTSSVPETVLKKLVENRIAMYQAGSGGTHWPHEHHDVDSGYTFAKGNSAKLDEHMWQLLAGQDFSAKFPIPEKGNEETGIVSNLEGEAN